MKAGIALGTNIEPREAHIREAWERLAALSTTPMLKSPIYETAPVDCPPGSPAFLNGVVEITTNLDPHKLFTKLQQAEVEMGRPSERARNSPRTIDLDLLYCDSIMINSEKLILPHPRIAERLFVLRPLADIRPDLTLPDFTENVKQIFERIFVESTNAKNLQTKQV
jgi:2-amino-4-hydroxy-6-hydroxymethyldihydropteridine diphosphokinase